MSLTPHNLPLDLSRPIPLFPLPNCVLFPGTVQPLHIFEPRYRQLMADTLDDQSAIAVALLRPGWEKDYYANPPVFDILCVGKIIAHEKLDDGKYNLLLHGLSRAAILTQKKDKPYRTAQLDHLPDLPPDDAHDSLQRQVLRSVLHKTALKELTITPSLESFFEETLPTSRLVDLLAFNLVQDVMNRQQLLEERDVRKRGELLLQHLMQLAAQLEAQQAPTPTPPNWPPPLSTN